MFSTNSIVNIDIKLIVHAVFKDWLQLMLSESTTSDLGKSSNGLIPLILRTNVSNPNDVAMPLAIGIAIIAKKGNPVWCACR